MLEGHTTASEPEADMAWDVTEPRFRRPSLAASWLGWPRVATIWQILSWAAGCG
jgi:hypothetical protein